MKAFINHNNLKLARLRVNLSLDAAAKKIGLSNSEKLESAESGESHITFKQLKNAAKTYDIPFGYFYLDEFPLLDKDIDIVDYRLNPDYYGTPKSSELIKTINIAVQKREDIIEISSALGYQLPELSFKLNEEDNIEEAGEKIRSLFPEKCFGSKSEIIKRLRAQLEVLGVFVYGTGGESHKKVSYSEFDGASIYFKTLPIIILNLVEIRKAKNRIVFTIFHELAHILLNNSAITDLYLKNNSKSKNSIQKTEVFCNKVAAAALLPKEKISCEFNGKNILELAEKFRVSKQVVTIRLRSLNKISQEQCQTYLKKFEEEYRLIPKPIYDDKSSPNPNVIKKRNLGDMYVRYVRDALSHNAVNYMDALSMLGMKDKAARKVLYGK